VPDDSWHRVWSRTPDPTSRASSSRIGFSTRTPAVEDRIFSTEQRRGGPAHARCGGSRDCAGLRSSTARRRRAAGGPSGRQGATEGAVRSGSRPRLAASITRRFLICSQQFRPRRTVGDEGIGWIVQISSRATAGRRRQRHARRAQKRAAASRCSPTQPPASPPTGDREATPLTIFKIDETRGIVVHNQKETIWPCERGSGQT
jgi:hypothetical protein